MVVDYSLEIKRNLGSSHTWVSAYCNDVMAYIPSKRVLEEGGYEGGARCFITGCQQAGRRRLKRRSTTRCFGVVKRCVQVFALKF